VDEKRRTVVAAPLTEEERAARLVEALLASLDEWIADLGEVESVTLPGSKRHVLHLTRRLAQTRVALRKLSGLPEDEVR
jgi:hypothetical protein